MAESLRGLTSNSQLWSLQCTGLWFPYLRKLGHCPFAVLLYPSCSLWLHRSFRRAPNARQFCLLFLYCSFPYRVGHAYTCCLGNLQHIQWKRNSQLTVKSFSLELPRTHLPSLSYDSPSETWRQCVTLPWVKSTSWVRQTRVTSPASLSLSCESQGKLFNFIFSQLQFFSWFIKWR